MSLLKIKFIRTLTMAIYIMFFVKSLNVFAQNISEKKIPNVIIITFSGVRNVESINDPTHQYIPYLWNKMFKEGVLYTNLVDLNHQFHMPVVRAINTGMNYPVFGGLLKAPSIFQYVKKKYNLSADKMWSIGHWFDTDYALETDDYSKDTSPCALSFLGMFSVGSGMSSEIKHILTKQELIFLESFPEAMEKTPEKWPNWDSLGMIQYQIFKKIMREFKPKLVHYIMNDVEIAHSDSFGSYVIALRTCDKRIFELWELIQKDSFYKDNTYLIVNIDHERNLYYMDHYENAYDNPSKVWMYIYGPGIKKGKVIERPIHHVDIFNTVAYIMDVETHFTKGRVLKDCFRNSN